MNNAPIIRAAIPADLPAVLNLLDACRLPSSDLTANSIANFHVAYTGNGALVGVAGLDEGGSQALLRSVAVDPNYRGRRIAAQLVEQCETSALIDGVNEVYLLTTTTPDFFRRMGYQALSRQVIPHEIAAHVQFRSLCPASAQCLGKRL